jgi:hypothetical protein
MQHAGLIRLALAFAALFASLSMVVWRQSRALEVLRELDRTRTAAAITEAERSDLSRQLEFLESRAHIVSEASRRLGLRVPSADEIVLMRLDGLNGVSTGQLARKDGRSTARPSSP